jgi:ribonuclease P protein component
VAASVPAEVQPVGRFPRSAHVRKRREYQRVQAGGSRVSLPHFVFVLLAREPDALGARLGITASRKVGNAVVRSRIRRLVREAFRATRDLFVADVDLVVIVKSAPSELGLADVVAEWRGAAPLLKRRIEAAKTGRQRR